MDTGLVEVDRPWLDYMREQSDKGSSLFGSLHHYHEAHGGLTIKQFETILRDYNTNELNKDIPIESGRRSVWGVVESMRMKEGYYGVYIQALLKLPNGNKVVVAKPMRDDWKVGAVVQVLTTVIPSSEDPHLGFGENTRRGYSREAREALARKEGAYLSVMR